MYIVGMSSLKHMKICFEYMVQFIRRSFELRSTNEPSAQHDMPRRISLVDWCVFRTSSMRNETAFIWNETKTGYREANFLSEVQKALFTFVEDVNSPKLTDCQSSL